MVHVPAVDWCQFDLVIFDVDGTLYDQGLLRKRMVGQLLRHTLSTGRLQTLRVVRAFRQERERLGDEQAADFMRLQYARTAQRMGISADQVRAIVDEWIERRPLPWLLRCRYQGVAPLFKALKTAGKRVAIFSDYPAREKLAALDLQVDDIACATDADIGRLKPDPLGLQVLLERNRTPASRALMIGDRADRDGAAARQAGVEVLLRSQRVQSGYVGFSRFDAPLFDPLYQSY